MPISCLNRTPRRLSQREGSSGTTVGPTSSPSGSSMKVGVENSNKNKQEKELPFLDGSVYKANFREPAVVEELGYCEGLFCYCFPSDDPRIKDHGDEPVIYDIVADPREENPLTPDNFPGYSELVATFNVALAEAEAEWMPPSQLTMFSQVMARPWMQPCANFPRCKT